jgi:hypothetical protein
MSLITVSAVATVWAAVMTLLGLHALTEGPGMLPLSVDSTRALGIAALAGGQFVFMSLVADRWFSHAHARLVLLLEGAVVLVFGVGLGMSVVSVITGGAL